MNQLTGKERAPFERALNFGPETILRFNIALVFVHAFCL
jgi:hypothetical protein